MMTMMMMVMMMIIMMIYQYDDDEQGCYPKKVCREIQKRLLGIFSGNLFFSLSKTQIF